MSDQKHPDAKTLREEVNALFGVRWDTLVEWTVISWLSIWFWSSRADPSISGNFFGWTDGPVTGIENFLRSLDITPPSWLTATIDWLLDPSREWLSTTLVVVAVVACVTAVRSYGLSGLRTLALLSTAVVCEIQGSFWPVVWILLAAAIPAAFAWGIGFVDSRREESKFSEYEYYFGRGIVSDYITRIVLLFLSPAFAPFLLAGQLVVSFRTNLPYEPAEELNKEVVNALKTRGDGQADELDALTSTAASAAIHLAGNTSRDARQIASAYRFQLKSRREAEEARARAERKRRDGWPDRGV
ncbi:hypothetical protein [Microbacterium sp. MYb45]|uniref:hypothetical protein n=1 Tax=Microbacterium sp. MYb45 TaxID=1827294 RepID=UPI000CFF2A2A|nr:hypothetical protein [Microbacterium sp. MYb45]PRB59015.1 hypothetical protein CQ034_15815 [Microbacterium sp. MYb45]